MNIAIIGAGHLGGAIGVRLAAKDHAISFGVPDASSSKYDPLKRTANIRFFNTSDAAKQAGIILLATPWKFTRQAVAECGSLEGKILVDCTNAIKADFSGLEFGHTTSAAETVASWAKRAKVVKCFNQTGAQNVANPEIGGRKLVMFSAGDDADAVKVTANLARDVGFEAVELKGLDMARQLEQLAWLWMATAYRQGKGADFGFALLHRK